MLIAKSTTLPPKKATSRCTILSLACLLIVLLDALHLQSVSPAQIREDDRDDISSLKEGYDTVIYEPSRSSSSNTTPRKSVAPATSTTRSGDAISNEARPIVLISDQSINAAALATTPTSSASNAAATQIAESSLNDEDSTSNTTILVDYHQQSYNLKLTTPATTISSRANNNHPVTKAKFKHALLSVRSLDTIVNQTTGPQVAASRTGADGEGNDGNESARTSGNKQVSSPAPSAIIVTAETTDQRIESAPSLRTQPESLRDLRDARLSDKVKINATIIFETLLKKKPYSKFWTAEQKWDDVFKRLMAIQGTAKDLLLKNLMRDISYYADVTLSHQCSEDLKFIQGYSKQSNNFRWLLHMLDSMGKSESGMLTGNLANLGHVIQCIKVRAPMRPSNDTFQERFFEQQAESLGERFRGKYCLASVRPVLPEKPRLVSRFSDILDTSILSNISYMGEPSEILKLRAADTTVPESVRKSIDRTRQLLDQIPFESELYQYLIAQRNFMFSLPRFIGVCYPSSCTRDDIRYSLQKTLDDQHQVVDVEFECEVEDDNFWSWLITPRLLAYVFLGLIATISLGASLLRYILVDKLGLKRKELSTGHKLNNLLGAIDMLSMDKCVGILFIKTKPASPIVDASKLENTRSTTIDALKGFLILILVYSQLVHLGCLPVPFMWAKWADAMFPFYRSLITQMFLNTSIWTEAFYMISAYLIGAKILENNRPRTIVQKHLPQQVPDFSIFALKRYVRLVLPMLAFILLNYVWPQLSNGFVFQDQANKLVTPCDKYGWTNMLLFHNQYSLNETCLWPTHVSASFFQLHLLSYPILLLLLNSMRVQVNSGRVRKLMNKAWGLSGLSVIAILALFGLVYPALVAYNQELIVPFLIDYLDFDNYRRVIEWTVVPTYNHLTSYMIGLALAYMVIKERAEREARKANSMSEWHGAYLYRENSYDSVISSSTQGLQCKPVFKCKLEQVSPSKSSQQTSDDGNSSGHSGAYDIGTWVSSVLASGLAVLVCFISLSVSWYWNGLGEPMSFGQTFWYMCTTKLVFNITFAYLFYKHVARRRNSNDPWMITRFLAPIGRMSLTVFYVSWLVIWFDLLASLYQWHPSHYFVFEKFNEIIFMTLVFSLFVYGAFEGTVKIVQYMNRAEKLRLLPVASDKSLLSPDAQTLGFASMFEPLNGSASGPVTGGEMMSGKGMKSTNDSYDREQASEFGGKQQKREGGGKGGQNSGAHMADTTDGNKSKAGGKRTEGRHLSVVDQYKLNAELRANYSFASIGLYESAGATDDLPQSQSPDGERIVSYQPSHKRT